MTFLNYPFDKKPTDEFRRYLAERRAQELDERAAEASAANSSEAARKVMRQVFSEEFLATIDPALHGDLMVLYARPLSAIVDFASAEGKAMNHPGHWQNDKVARRPSDYLMRRLNIAYRNDPRYTPEQIQKNRDFALIHLAMASILVPTDTQAFSNLRRKLVPLTKRFLAKRTDHITSAIMGNYSGIAPPL